MRTFIIATLALALMSIAVSPTAAQSCVSTGSTSSNFSNWSSQFLNATDLVLKRGIVLSNPENYPVRICNIQIPLRENCALSQQITVTMNRQLSNGQPGSQVGLTESLTVPSTQALVSLDFGGQAVMEPNTPYMVVIDYGSSCVIGGISGPIAQSGPLSESWAFTQQSGVTFWFRSDVPAIYQMTYEGNTRALFDQYGVGCTGTSGVPCSTSPTQSLNWGSMIPVNPLMPGQWAVQVRDNFGYPTRDLCKIEMPMSTFGAAAQVMSVRISDEVGALPNQVLGSTQVTVQPGPVAIEEIVFDPPVRISAGANYWVLLEPTAPLQGPIVQFGAPVRQAINTPSGWVASTTNAWALRSFQTLFVGPPSPRIVGPTPKIGQSGNIRLLYGPASSAATLAIGVTAMDLDLGPLGAPGCRLLTSVDWFTTLPTNSSGQADFPYALPNDPGLIGTEIRAQWFMLTTQNALGLLASEAARLVIGTF